MDIDYNALFGLEPEASENTQEAAEPETEETEERAEEVTAPDEDAEAAEPESAAEETEDAADAGTAETSTTQSREENAKYAAARRKAERERDAAIEKAKADAKAEAERVITEYLKASGMQDPYTGTVIDSPDKLREYAKQHTAERRQQLIRKSGMSDEEFDEFLADQPEIREAREAKKKAEDAEKEAMELRAKARVDSQMEEIRKLDPTIKDISDLAKAENYGEIYEKVKAGYSIVDAYKLANWEALQQNAQRAAQQTARNASSKQHMQTHSARGSGAVTVPPEVMAQYRLFNPDATEAEITAHYNKNHHKN